MFKDEYRKAYDKVNIDESKLQDLIKKSEQENFSKTNRFRYLIGPIAIPVLSLCLLFMITLPVLAEKIPAVYQVIQQFAPSLVDYVLPEEVSDTNNDITLNVEAINIEGKEAEIILSFSDAVGSQKDLIHGKVDMYDSYEIENYGETLVMGGCNYLGYDEDEDKAYFKINVTSDQEFNKDKVRFSVRQLLTDCSKEEQLIALDNVIKEPKEKNVTCNGFGGTDQARNEMPFLIDGENSHFQPARVLDVMEREASWLDTLSVTGIAYNEGILRVQQCRGNLSEVDRHISLFLSDEEGNEITPDYSVGWKEEIASKKASFDEDWFKISESELSKYELYGMFYITGGSMNGNWEVVVNLNKE